MDGNFDNESESTITINEYLEEVEAEELEADLVLGGDEGKECTYGKGYMKRQAIFSCQTCTPEGNAGICTACSLACHDGHEIVELWTKRNFRCDCGNSKFGGSFCKILPLKDVENADNSYNHNFKGKYCTCDGVYPDPSAEDQQEMIQCTICEDWFHEEHIGLESTTIPKDEDGEPIYEDFICNKCSSLFSFLRLYPNKIWAVSGQSGSLEANPDEESYVLVGNTEGGSSSSNITHGCPCSSDSDGSNSNSSVVDDGSKPMFLAKGWRDMLCRCEGCLKMYEKKCISYLVVKEDSIAEYEKCAKNKRAEKVDEMSYLNGLGHVEKIELLNGMADFKEEFRSFLESYDSSKAITSSDIHKIFDNLAKKRKRLG